MVHAWRELKIHRFDHYNLIYKLSYVLQLQNGNFVIAAFYFSFYAAGKLTSMDKITQ